MGRTSILSAELLNALTEVGARLRQGDNVAAELDTTLKLLASLRPGHVARADGEIANAADLNRHPPQPLFGRLLAPRPSEAEQLLRVPGLEYLFLFHRDG